MQAASILVKPSSANCNIDCKYCFYKVLCSNRCEYSKGFMSYDTLEKLVYHGTAYADSYLAFAFQGGEPTLAGLDFYKKAVQLQEKYKKSGLVIENTIQTNGILIDDEWAEFLAQNHFLVGLSLDGPKKIHDSARKGMQGEKTFERVMETVNILRKHNVDFNIVSVITKESVTKASYLYKFYKRNHFDYIQIIPCMNEKGRAARENDDLYAVEPEEYGKFLCELFDLWYADFAVGEHMDIRMFSNLAQMAAGYPAEECGMNGHCNCYFVVEADGSVYPCDFYCTDEWQLGSLEQPFEKMYNSESAKKFVEMSLHTDRKCSECEYFSLCRGGCRRWREPFNKGNAGLNYLCPAYERFFEHTYERIQRLGQYILRR